MSLSTLTHHFMSQRSRVATFALAAAALTVGLDAQTLQLIGAGAPMVVEQTGPPAGPCGYPTGPVVGGFPTAPVAWPCPVVAPIAPGALFGGLTVNRAADTTWVTDGAVFTEYGPGGAVVNSFAGVVGVFLGGPITGITWDAGIGGLWVTDGAGVAGIIPPPVPGCVPPFLFFPPFPLPPLPGGVATGITWDPFFGTLHVCDAGGFISTAAPGGGPGAFPPYPLPPFGCLVPPLTGLTLDTAATAAIGLPVLFVTDLAGAIQAVTPGGPPPPPTMYAPLPCFPSFVPFPAGIGFSGHGISYGMGADNTGLAPPTSGSLGQTTSPSPAYATTLAGSVPGSTAILYGSTGGFLCPAFPVAGLPLLISPLPGLLTLGVAPVALGGGAVLPTPLPPGMPPGFTVETQWLVLTPVPSLQVSDGLHVTIVVP